MIRGIALFLLIFVNQTFGDVQNLSALPSGTSASAIQVDASGYIYVAGSITPQSPKSTADTMDAFAAMLSPDASHVIWFTTLAGSSVDSISAIAVGFDGSIYLMGDSQSTDFPTTKGSMQPGLGSAAQAFAAKLSPAGAVVYATFLGGTAITYSGAVVVDAAGHAFLTGTTGLAGFPTTPGAVVGDPSVYTELVVDWQTGFIVELNASGSAAVVAIRGFGGRRIAVDTQGNIYAAGSFAGPSGPLTPTTPGAFQTTAGNQICLSLGLFGEFPCTYQHIAKIDPTGTQLMYATYIAGQLGAEPVGIAVDASGNVIVAGFTNGSDYPVTPGAYQSLYTADPRFILLPIADLEAPPYAGYVTKLNATGTGILWSSYFSGSGAGGIQVNGSEGAVVGDYINSMAIDGSGNIVIGGSAGSRDLPGLWTTPVASRPSATSNAGFVARFSSDGGTISATQILPNIAARIAVRTDGTVVALGRALSIVSFPPDGRVDAIADPADNARVVNIAPGQLLTLYGANLAPSSPAVPSSGFPASFSGVTVTFNGIPAPILYTSGIQINLQVPYEIAGQTQVTMLVSSQLVTPPVSELYILGVVAPQPSVFLSATNFNGPIFGELSCNGTVYSGVQALALNTDGSVNSCGNPAAPGAVVSIFVNGLGVTTPSLSTGTVNSTAPVALTPAVAVNVPATSAPASAISTAAAPGAISGLAEAMLQLTTGGSTSNAPAVTIPLDVAGVRMREQNIVIWVKSAN
jgi:uncharacterized protein (TIGR03437 family)